MLIPILQKEDQLQLSDLTRFDARQSLAVKGSVNPIDAVLIKPELSASEIDVFHSNPQNWFLDYIYTAFTFDIADPINKIPFEVNGTTLVASLTTGTYSLVNLLNEIKIKIEALASPLSVSFEVDDRNRVKTSPSLSLKFLPNHSSGALLKLLNFKQDSMTSDPVDRCSKIITLKVESSSEDATAAHIVEVFSEQGDALFSSDQDLTAEEPDILKWIKPGRSSYNDLHRKAQKSIVDWIDRQGYRDDLQNKLTKWSVLDNRDVREWSTYAALKFFFSGAHNSKDDVFSDKAAHYAKEEIAARGRALISLDLNNDGEEDVQKGPDISSGRLFFR